MDPSSAQLLSTSDNVGFSALDQSEHNPIDEAWVCTEWDYTPEKPMPRKSKVVGKAVVRKHSPAALQSALCNIFSDPWPILSEVGGFVGLQTHMVNPKFLTSEAEHNFYPRAFDKDASGQLTTDTAVTSYRRPNPLEPPPDSEDIRTIQALHRTMLHIIDTVVDADKGNDERFEKPPTLAMIQTYTFDRVRMVAREISFQNYGPGERNDAIVMEILELMVRLYCCFLYEGWSIENWRSTIGIQLAQVTSSLKTLTGLYNDARKRSHGAAALRSPNEEEFRVYYCLMLLADEQEGSAFAAELNRLVRYFGPNSPGVEFVREISLAIRTNNSVRFFLLLRSTTFLNQCILSRYIHRMRGEALNIINVGMKARMANRLGDLTLSAVYDALGIANKDHAVYLAGMYGMTVSRRGKGHVLVPGDIPKLTLPELFQDMEPNLIPLPTSRRDVIRRSMWASESRLHVLRPGEVCTSVAHLANRFRAHDSNLSDKVIARLSQQYDATDTSVAPPRQVSGKHPSKLKQDEPSDKPPMKAPMTAAPQADIMSMKVKREPGTSAVQPAPSAPFSTALQRTTSVVSSAGEAPVKKGATQTAERSEMPKSVLERLPSTPKGASKLEQVQMSPELHPLFRATYQAPAASGVTNAPTATTLNATTPAATTTLREATTQPAVPSLPPTPQALPTPTPSLEREPSVASTKPVLDSPAALVRQTTTAIEAPSSPNGTVVVATTPPVKVNVKPALFKPRSKASKQQQWIDVIREERRRIEAANAEAARQREELAKQRRAQQQLVLQRWREASLSVIRRTFARLVQWKDSMQTLRQQLDDSTCQLHVYQRHPVHRVAAMGLRARPTGAALLPARAVTAGYTAVSSYKSAQTYAARLLQLVAQQSWAGWGRIDLRRLLLGPVASAPEPIDAVKMVFVTHNGDVDATTSASVTQWLRAKLCSTPPKAAPTDTALPQVTTLCVMHEEFQLLKSTRHLSLHCSELQCHSENMSSSHSLALVRTALANATIVAIVVHFFLQPDAYDGNVIDQSMLQQERYRVSEVLDSIMPHAGAVVMLMPVYTVAANSPPAAHAHKPLSKLEVLDALELDLTLLQSRVSALSVVNLQDLKERPLFSPKRNQQATHPSETELMDYDSDDSTSAAESTQSISASPALGQHVLGVASPLMLSGKSLCEAISWGVLSTTPVHMQEVSAPVLLTRLHEWVSKSITAVDVPVCASPIAAERVLNQLVQTVCDACIYQLVPLQDMQWPPAELQTALQRLNVVTRRTYASDVFAVSHQLNRVHVEAAQRACAQTTPPAAGSELLKQLPQRLRSMRKQNAICLAAAYEACIRIVCAVVGCDAESYVAGTATEDCVTVSRMRFLVHTRDRYFARKRPRTAAGMSQRYPFALCVPTVAVQCADAIDELLAQCLLTCHDQDQPLVLVPWLSVLMEVQKLQLTQATADSASVAYMARAALQRLYMSMKVTLAEELVSLQQTTEEACAACIAHEHIPLQEQLWPYVSAIEEESIDVSQAASPIKIIDLTRSESEDDHTAATAEWSEGESEQAGVIVGQKRVRREEAAAVSELTAELQASQDFTAELEQAISSDTGVTNLSYHSISSVVAGRNLLNASFLSQMPTPYKLPCSPLVIHEASAASDELADAHNGSDWRSALVTDAHAVVDVLHSLKQPVTASLRHSLTSALTMKRKITDRASAEADLLRELRKERRMQSDLLRYVETSAATASDAEE